jgi:hypothetical protein
VSAPRKLSRGTPLESLLALLCFELAVFAVEIIDLGFHLRHLTLQTSHVFVELLQLERQLTRPMLEVIAIGLLLQGLLDLLYLLQGLLDLL